MTSVPVGPFDPQTQLDHPDQHLVEHTVSSQEILKGRFLHAFRDMVRMPDGASASREYVIHPGAVMVVAELDDGRIILERQYRYPVQNVMIEFPAGKLDPDESSLVCAQRELLEETGYTAREWARAGVLHPVIAYSTEFIDVWFARGLQGGERKLDAGEFLDVFTATLEELMSWSRHGQITDTKTLSGVLWLQNLRLGTWSLDWHLADAASVPIMAA